MDNESNETENENVSTETSNTTPIIHSAVGDIHMPTSKMPFDLNFDFSPDAPVTIESNASPEGYGVSTSEKGIQSPKPGFFKTAEKEAYQFNITAEAAHAAYEKHLQPNPLDDIPPSDWKPTSQPEMFYDVQPQYMAYLLDARGPKDLQYRRDRVMGEQADDEALENGSMFAKIIGGVAGAVTDPVSYIPVAGWAKYAKFAPTIFKQFARSLPGAATYGVIASASKQLDKVNGNLQDFVIDAALNTVFGATIFGGAAGVSLAVEKMNLWGLRDLAKSTIKGVDFKFETNDAGELKGIKAFDTTGGLSAQEVSYAQDLANSSFNKSGLFKIPYLGTGLIKLKSLPGMGSPLLNMLNSPYVTVRGFIDRAADHSILTKNVAEGGIAPKSFEQHMKQEFSGLRSIAAQMNALHLQRNGFNLKTRPVQGVTQIGLGLYNATLKKLSNDVEKNGYVSRDDFNDEVQRVLYSDEQSEHSSVNQAASLVRKKIDDTYKSYLNAYNLPEDLLPPKTAASYLMRVYNTDYLNVNKGHWVSTISNWLKDSDAMISDRMKPITDLTSQIKDFEEKHTTAVEELGRREKTPGNLLQQKEQYIPKEELQIGKAKVDKKLDAKVRLLSNMRQQLKSLKEDLQNELRSNPDYSIHVDNIHALSANESKELKQILTPLKNLTDKVDEQQKLIDSMKRESSKKLRTTKTKATKEKAKPHAEQYVLMKEQLQNEEDKLAELKNAAADEENRLYEAMRDRQINPRLYYPNALKFKDPNDRLKFRDVYDSHAAREHHAAAYYDSILHQTPEDTISDVMGRVTGNPKENHLKSRTLIVPDELLYNNNFMTKDLMAKVYNYVLYLSRRTHLKNVYKDVTHEGGIEPILEKLNMEYQARRAPFDTRKSDIDVKLKNIAEQSKNTGLSDSDKARLQSEKEELMKESKAVSKQIDIEAKKFSSAKGYMNKAYEKMMGINKRSNVENNLISTIRSITAMTNLHFLAATQIADLGTIGLQHGVWPFVRDGVYPIIQSLGGILKTQDSEALRKSAPAIDLALQDVLNGYGDKNWSMEAQPYINLGKIVGGVEKLAHFSSNVDLTTYIDNGLQRLSGAVVQSEFMRILHAQVDGTITKKDSEYLRKYGIDPKEWGERMVNAYKASSGYKTKLGGYQSKFWEWQDMEAANHFSDAVFKGIQNTIINRGMFDSPFWMDNALGVLFGTFTGWGYASINRYLIPMLQRPDAEKMLGVLMALGFGALVSPTRRAIRGEDPIPEGMTDAQRFYEAVNDSNVGSAIANTLDWANLLSGDRLMGDLKNDKYRQRTQLGSLGPVFSTGQRMFSIFQALASGQMNQKDAEQMARMLPFTGTMWGFYMSKMLIDKLGLPPTRRAAAAE